MSRAAQRGEEVRGRLLGAAADLIAEHGWSAVSTRMVAQRAGVTPGVVHYHFASVRDLLTKATLHAVRSVADEVAVILTPDADLRGGLAPLVRALDRYPGHDAINRLFVEAYLEAHRNPELRAGLARVVREVRDQIARWLTANNVPAAEDTAAVLAAAIDGVMLHRALTPDLDAATVTSVLTRLLHTAESPAPGTQPRETP